LGKLGKEPLEIPRSGETNPRKEMTSRPGRGGNSKRENQKSGGVGREMGRFRKKARLGHKGSMLQGNWGF